MKNLAILFSIIYCSVFCNILYSQNISDSAITAVKDVVISIEYDKVYDEFHYVAEIKDFFSSKYIKDIQMKDMDLINTMKSYITMRIKKP